MESKFEAIRPYNDNEIPAAIERLLANAGVDKIADHFKLDRAFLRAKLAECKRVDYFQEQIMSFIMSIIMKETTAGLTYGGEQYFEGGKKHVILSNHRDIVLDPAFLQVILHKNRVTTTEIAVGDNLISSPFIEDIIRSNKMIKVTRSHSPREVYEASKLLSEYIRSQVATQKSSIWIAQRNGRSKDGNDQTEQGLLKMLDMSSQGDFEGGMKALDLLPLAVSYEFEPCAAYKTREVYVSRRQTYVKAPDEDLNSIITGISQWKGRIHFEFTEPILPSEVEYCARFKKNERFQELAKIIDRQIYSAYKLWPNNFIAADLLAAMEGGCDGGSAAKYADHYTADEKKAFEEYLREQLADLQGDADELKSILLGIYANPVKNQIKSRFI